MRMLTVGSLELSQGPEILPQARLKNGLVLKEFSFLETALKEILLVSECASVKAKLHGPVVLKFDSLTLLCWVKLGDGTWYKAVVMRVGADGRCVVRPELIFNAGVVPEFCLESLTKHFLDCCAVAVEMFMDFPSFDLEYDAGGREREVPAHCVRQRYASSWPPPAVDDDGLPIVVLETTTPTSTDNDQRIAETFSSPTDEKSLPEIVTNSQPQSLAPALSDLPLPIHSEVVAQHLQEPIDSRVDSLRNALAAAKLSHYYEVCTLAEMLDVNYQPNGKRLFELASVSLILFYEPAVC